jgi:hypothetical protein
MYGAMWHSRDDVDHMMMMPTCDDDQVLNLQKKKEKNKILWSLRQRYKYEFCFGDQDTIESVITFRIDGRTIKRGS